MFGHKDKTPININITNDSNNTFNYYIQRCDCSRVRLDIGIFVNNKFYLMADISLQLGGTPPNPGVFTLTDNKTGVVVAATFSNQTVGTNTNPEFATFSLDPSNPNQVNATPLAAGSGQVTFSTHADYSDLGDNTPQSEDFTITKNYTVTQVTTPDGVSFDVVFP
jgi:hypothetical protein